MIDTSSVLAGQKPLLIVHLNVAVLPMLNPLTPVVDSVAVVTVAVPLTTLHTPVPTTGVFPFRVAVLRLQNCWSISALAVVGSSDTLITTSSVVAVHVPLLIVHCNVVLVPGVKPLMAEVSELGDAMVAVPLTTLHVPIPTPAELALMFVVVTLHRS